MKHEKPRIVDVVELPLQNEKSGSFIARVREVIQVIRAGHSPKRDNVMQEPAKFPLELRKHDEKI
jgi:hypothetical protein